MISAEEITRVAVQSHDRKIDWDTEGPEWRRLAYERQAEVERLQQFILKLLAGY